MKLHQLTLATATALALGIGGAMAANAPGVTDTEITIGNTNTIRIKSHKIIELLSVGVFNIHFNSTIQLFSSLR